MTPIIPTIPDRNIDPFNLAKFLYADYSAENERSIKALLFTLWISLGDDTLFRKLEEHLIGYSDLELGMHIRSISGWLDSPYGGKVPSDLCITSKKEALQFSSHGVSSTLTAGENDRGGCVAVLDVPLGNNGKVQFTARNDYGDVHPILTQVDYYQSDGSLGPSFELYYDG